MKNKLIFTYKKTHKKMLKIITDSKKYIFLTAYDFDWNYDKNIKNEIINSLNRGVKIYITLSNHSSLFENTIDYTHPNLYVRLSKLYNKGDNKLFDWSVKLFTKASHFQKVVVHMRFIYNGDALLIGGTNVNHEYNGTYTVRNIKSKDEHEFYWYDNGYLTYDYPDKFEFFHSLYKDNHKKIRKMSLDKTLFISNELQYTFICKHIRNAKTSIYIECQYFHTYEQFMSNEIGIELAKRVNKAIKNKESFMLTIITNSINHDEYYLNYITSGLSYICLIWFRSLIHCDDDTFKKYVICKMPTVESKIVIHSKCWIFDESIALYTTGNLSDRSFYNTGDIEMAVIIRKGISDFIKCISKTQKQVPFFKYDFKYPSFNTGYKYVDNVNYLKKMYTVLNKVFTPITFLLYNSDFHSVIGVKYS
jgi:phosphatidylserine/phosphatidylglycerophosphate/cardiolipin synthase-like enzyme